MSLERIWTAALVVIGDEILSGRTQDKNVAQIAAWLNVQGIRLAELVGVVLTTAACRRARCRHVERRRAGGQQRAVRSPQVSRQAVHLAQRHP